MIFTGSTELVAVTPAHRVYYHESVCTSLQFITMDAAMALPLIVSPIFHSLAFAEWNIGEIFLFLPEVTLRFLVLRYLYLTLAFPTWTILRNIQRDILFIINDFQI